MLWIQTLVPEVELKIVRLVLTINFSVEVAKKKLDTCQGQTARASNCVKLYLLGYLLKNKQFVFSNQEDFRTFLTDKALQYRKT